MSDRRRRSEKLVNDIRGALERGVSAEIVQTVLVERGLAADKAGRLVERIAATTSSQPAAAPPAVPVASVPPRSALRLADDPDLPGTRADANSPARILAFAADAPPILLPASELSQRRVASRRRTPFFLAAAVMLVTVGFTGAFMSSAESTERRDAEEVARLEGEVTAARNHLEHLESRIAERRVDAEQIEWLRARVARGPASFETPNDYAAMVARYQRRRAGWNRTLPAYEVVTQAFRLMAEIHNAKVDSLALYRSRLPDSPDEAVERQYVRIAAATPPM